MNSITSKRVVTFVLLLAVLVILFAPRPAPIPNVHASPGVLYAAPTARGSGDCSSWDNACTLQTALAQASSGDEIWVQAGAHYPTTDPNNRTATFTLKNGVALYGGFAGTETSRDARNWRTNATILSGDIDRNDNHGGDYINENASQIVGTNAYHVVTGSGTDTSAVLDGFIITAGQANGDMANRNGGGIYSESGSPTLTNIICSGNSASWDGGGMVNISGSNPALTNVTFSGNSATYGGGMFNEGSNPTLTRVTFGGNWAESGGGMANYSSNPTLTNVIFSGNSAQYDGGGMYNDGSNPVLINATFSGNSAESGGGMANYSSSPMLTSVIMWGNDGTGIYNDDSTPSIAYSDIEGCGDSQNWNSDCGTDGGGNIQADPLFINAAGGNLRLDFGSPAVDAGSPSTCPAPDLDGLPRPTDGNSDGTATCDIGAYEAGTMICGVTENEPHTFEHQSSVVITVTTRGNLDCLYVDEMGINHPAAPPNIQTGRYWLIRGLQSDQQTDATGFTVNLTLPTAFTPGLNDKVCRYTGSGWDCAAHYFTENTITREGVTVLSDWVVGRNVGPTAVVLRRLRAQDIGPVTVVTIILGLAIAFLLRQRR